MFGRKKDEDFAAEEQTRADGLAQRCEEISSTPGHPSAGSLPFYQAAYQDASGNAAASTDQPKRRWGR
jgi:hypothetical protein